MIYSFRTEEKVSIPSKKNNKQIIHVAGKPIVISSKTFSTFEKWAVPAMRVAHKFEVINIPVKIVFTIGKPDKRKRDIDNAITSLLDCLVKAEVLEDDNTTIVKEIHAYHSDDFGFNIEIYKL